MRSLIVAVFALCLMSGAASAQDAGQAHRRELAQQYLDLSFGPEFQRALEEQLKEAYGKASEITPEQRSWLTSHMSSAFQTILPQVAADVRDETAELYTAEELEALIAFQSTPVGRSISIKGMRMSALISQHMQAPLMEAMTSLRQKYCAEFDCPASGVAGAAKAE